MNVVANFASVWIVALGVASLLVFGIGLYWLVNKQARLRDIAYLRRKLDELEPTDPEYNAVRALYTSMMIDAHRWGFFGSDADAGGGAAHHSGDGHVGEHAGASDH
ncbi:hypothetical protein HAP47_0000720 [Bradyrhizobium sp. 41S5]|uniref:hypothetical protein n=1 Tax=Bradyrhizobium sp. 41S5 TaxID=1404443 RepID=UPI00156BCE65|nr:hypothetical protein [Bradyrhizobium sp. 41S5]UFX45296.1 hypothetical protein HAP47_0000720 [Bradyrhizobium sp. 41S5]